MAKTEIWVDKPDIPKVVIEMLLATAEEYDLVFWLNGVKIWPKTREEEQRRQALLGQ